MKKEKQDLDDILYKKCIEYTWKNKTARNSNQFQLFDKNFPNKRAQNVQQAKAHLACIVDRELNKREEPPYLYIYGIADYYRDITAVEKSDNWREEA